MVFNVSRKKLHLKKQIRMTCKTFQISTSSPSILYLRFLFYYYFIFLEIKRGRKRYWYRQCHLYICIIGILHIIHICRFTYNYYISNIWHILLSFIFLVNCKFHEGKDSVLTFYAHEIETFLVYRECLIYFWWRNGQENEEMNVWMKSDGGFALPLMDRASKCIFS